MTFEHYECVSVRVHMRVRVLTPVRVCVRWYLCEVSVLVSVCVCMFIMLMVEHTSTPSVGRQAFAVTQQGKCLQQCIRVVSSAVRRHAVDEVRQVARVFGGGERQSFSAEHVWASLYLFLTDSASKLPVDLPAKTRLCISYIPRLSVDPGSVLVPAASISIICQHV